MIWPALIPLLALLGVSGLTVNDYRITQQDLENAKVELARLQTEAGEAKTLRVENENLRTAAATLETERDALKTGNGWLYETLEESRKKIVELDARNMDLNYEAGRLAQNLGTLTDEHAATRAANDKLRIENDETAKYAKTLEATIADLKNRAVASEKVLTKQRKDIAALKETEAKLAALSNKNWKRAFTAEERNKELGIQLVKTGDELKIVNDRLNLRTITAYGLFFLLMLAIGLVIINLLGLKTFAKKHAELKDSLRRYLGVGENFMFTDDALKVEGVDFKMHCTEHPSSPIMPKNLLHHLKKAHAVQENLPMSTFPVRTAPAESAKPNGTPAGKSAEPNQSCPTGKTDCGFSAEKNPGQNS